jgi:SAM-dependent methyltransferase
MDVEQIVAECEPSVSLPELVKALNLFYHEFEAECYDRTHDVIWKHELPVFVKLVEAVRDSLNLPSVAVLDFGCGTGFGCYHVVKIVGAGRINSVVCVDPSPAMLAKCKQRLDGVFAEARYTNDPDAFLACQEWLGHFDIVVTNSVLHHVYAWEKLLGRLVELLKPGGFYVMGHEPSSRFYTNPECRKHYAAFLRERGWRRFLDGRRWVAFARQKFGLEPDLLHSTAQAALEAGLTQRLLDRKVVAELVDYHVPHVVRGAARAEGLDFRLIESQMAGVLSLHAVATYAYTGGFLPESLPRKWRRIAEHLGKAYPLDGANFCALWKKVA